MAEERPRGRRGGPDRRGGRRRGGGHPPKSAPYTATRRPAEPVAVAEVSPDEEGAIDLNSLYKMDNQALMAAAQTLDVSGTATMRNQELLFEIMKAQSEKSGLVFAEGVLQILQDGYGFLRHPDYN